jgi:hypothetical protein
MRPLYRHADSHINGRLIRGAKIDHHLSEDF